jgi:hypothetical protein
MMRAWQKGFPIYYLILDCHYLPVLHVDICHYIVTPFIRKQSRLLCLYLHVRSLLINGVHLLFIGEAGVAIWRQKVAIIRIHA